MTWKLAESVGAVSEIRKSAPFVSYDVWPRSVTLNKPTWQQSNVWTNYSSIVTHYNTSQAKGTTLRLLTKPFNLTLAHTDNAITNGDVHSFRENVWFGLKPLFSFPSITTARGHHVSIGYSTHRRNVFVMKPQGQTIRLVEYIVFICKEASHRELPIYNPFL